jgi:hypothetical protein
MNEFANARSIPADKPASGIEADNTAADIAAAATLAPATTVGKIEAWFTEHFHNSEVSRAPTEVYNAAHDAKEDLKATFSGKDAPTGPEAVSAAVDHWYAAHFLDTPLARAGAEIGELCHNAKEKLKVLLGG